MTSPFCTQRYKYVKMKKCLNLIFLVINEPQFDPCLNYACDLSFKFSK
jgi:hypothetical protein